MMEGVSSSHDQPVNHCIVKGSSNNVVMTGDGSSVSVNLYKPKQRQSNSDSGYEDDASQRDSTTEDMTEEDAKSNEDDLPMEMDNPVTSSCIVKGDENVVVMSGDGSNVKVNVNDNKAADEDITEDDDDKQSDVNSNNNNMKSNQCPPKEQTDAFPNLDTKDSMLHDGTDVGERPVAHVQPMPQKKKNEDEIPTRSNSNNAIVSNEYSLGNSNPSSLRPKRRLVEEVEESNEFCKKQKTNDAAAQECGPSSCQTFHRVNIEGADNTVITAGSGSTIHYFQCKHSQKESTKNDYNIDHIDGETLKKTGMMSFFQRISKHIGSTSNKWKQLARELPMVSYDILEKEIKFLEQTPETTEQKAFAVLVKWWRRNSGDTGMKKNLVAALRYIKLPWLAATLEKEIEGLS
ncbi:uncharacterized protein [Antedon mediterranea]|uniref:uncharacterized protein n=1 Tax=Antedon mediterranea TaxID=105859 RepID=UPI003AF5E7C3